MLLRRLSQHVKDQNWFAVLLDFVIVVFGVFIGIQVSNWNETRKDRVDERVFLARLHNDVYNAVAASERIRERRLNAIQESKVALGVLNGDSDWRELTQGECRALSSSHNIVIGAPGLPAFDELVSSGRLAIIRDPQLRQDLVAFEQAQDILAYWLSEGSRNLHDLLDKYPNLFSLTTYLDDQLEVRSAVDCKMDGMNTNTRFMNNIGFNVDLGDALGRDALIPWSDRLLSLHSRLDEILEIEHLVQSE